MSSTISLKDVAKTAGVAESTVSRVLSGKADKGRICPETQNRIRTLANQLGYRPNRNTRFGAGGSPKQPTPSLSSVPSGNTPTAPASGRQIGLILSAASPADALSLIPGLEPGLASAGYQLVVMTLPADTASAAERLMQWTQTVAGIICCPSVYASVSATVAGRRPVIVLWQGATKAMTQALTIPNAAPVSPTIPSPVPPLAPRPPSTTPPTVATSAPPVTAPRAIATPTPPAAAPEPEPISTPITREPEVVVVAAPAPEPIIEPTPAPVITPEPVPVVLAPEPEPVAVAEPTPVPVITEPPPVSPEPVVPEEPAPEPIIKEDADLVASSRSARILQAEFTFLA